ncbi:MAG: hypothetical protein JSS79_19570 [Bacteroidetes bacterium]|nr:hypothetical protein [Bacteroidota bacterium]
MTEATVEIITMMLVVYMLGIFVYSGTITILINLVFKKHVKFTALLLHCFYGALVGVFIAVSVFQIAKPTDLIYGQPEWDSKFDFFVGLANFCMLFPISTILVGSAYSIWKQLKKQ